MKWHALKSPLMHESIIEDAQAVIDRRTRLTVHLSVMQLHLCVRNKSTISCAMPREFGVLVFRTHIKRAVLSQE